MASAGQWRTAGDGSGRSFQLVGCNEPRCAPGRQYRRDIKMYPRQFPPLHTGSSEFIRIRDQGGLYVDKTGFFRQLLEVTPVKSGGVPPLAHQFQFLARPRRFGKSLLISTLEAWFQGIPPNSAVSTDDAHNRPVVSQPQEWSNPDWLWQGLDSDEWHGVNGWHPVLRLDMSAVSGPSATAIQGALGLEMVRLARGWARRGVPWGTDYLPPIPQHNDEPAMALRNIIDGVYHHFQTTVVVVVDEYDAPLHRFIGGVEGADEALEVLHDFYTVLKASQSQLYLVFLTGISRFSRVNLFSALNNLVDWSDWPAAAALCGFTQNELETYFAPYLEWIESETPELAGGHLMDGLRTHYNGYRFGPDPETPQVYNPFTLLECMRLMEAPGIRHRALEGDFPNMWALSGSPTLLVKLVQQGRSRLPDPSLPWEYQQGTAYRLDAPDFTALMLQSGYYTLKGGGETPLMVDFPNREVRDTYARDLLAAYDIDLNPARLQPMHAALANGDLETWVRELTTFFHGLAHQNLTTEAPYRAVLQSLLIAIGVDAHAEMSVWSGDADLVASIEDRTYVMELKFNRTVAAARAQVVRQKAYAEGWTHGSRTVYGVYLNFRREAASNTPPTIECEWEILYSPNA